MTDQPTRTLQLRTLVTEEQTVELSLQETELPAPGPDQVLVRVEAAPINPSDLGLLLAGADLGRVTAAGTEARPVLTAPLPAAAVRAAAARTGQSLPAGNEGAGTVIAAGESAAAQALAGKLVAMAGGAMYAQYRLIDAAACLELPPGASAADGASSYVNPMTVLAMIETMRAEGHTALVHTAAASNLGQMLNRLCLAESIPLVCVVRSAAQADLLRKAGARYVCNSAGPGFAPELTAAITATSATLAFDATGGGTLASQILACMEASLSAGAAFSRYGSAVHKQVYLYGSLDRSPTELHRTYGMAWGVGGWLLTNYLRQAGSAKLTELRQRVAAGLTTIFASHYTDRVSLAGALAPEAVAVYGRQATGQKYLIVPTA